MKTFILLGKELEHRQKYRIFHVERLKNFPIPSCAGEIAFDKKFAEPTKDSDGILRIPAVYEGVPYRLSLEALYKTDWTKKFSRKTQMTFVTFVAVLSDFNGNLLEGGIVGQFELDTLGYEKGW